MHLLKSIRIQNFKSFTDEKIDFDVVSCFVGANESGKSNLLDATYHLSGKRQSEPFTPDELRIGAPGYPRGEVKITFTLIIQGTLFEDMLVSFPRIRGRTFTLVKKGTPKDKPIWVSDSDIVQGAIPDIVKIVNKRAFAQSLRDDKSLNKTVKERSDRGWFIDDRSVDLRKNPYKRLLDQKHIRLLKGRDKVDFVNRKLQESILKNIRIYQWRYREEDFLQETVPLADLLDKPQRFRSVTNMLLISGWEIKNFSTNLKNQTPTVYSNLLNQVKRKINGLIKNQWSTHQNLKIELQHRGDHLTIHLHEPGSSTPPEFRSDGLKWFLTFLINFRAQSKDVANHILLIDEPGLYLHPRGQKDVLEELENLSKENQIIYTTHQTFLINKNKPERTRVIRRETERKGKLAANPFYASQVVSSLNPKNILTDRLLREALGFKVSDVSPINEKNILVEGVFDRELLHLVNEKFQIVDLNQTSIISCGRASNISKHAALYISNDLKVVCFYDSDAPGKAAYKLNTNVGTRQKRQIRDYARQKENETMEDLLPDSVFDNAFLQWYKTWQTGSSPKVGRPRISQIRDLMNAETKTDMKHSLENLLLCYTKKELSSNGCAFDTLKKILEDLKNRLK